MGHNILHMEVDWLRLLSVSSGRRNTNVCQSVSVYQSEAPYVEPIWQMCKVYDQAQRQECVCEFSTKCLRQSKHNGKCCKRGSSLQNCRTKRKQSFSYAVSSRSSFQYVPPLCFFLKHLFKLYILSPSAKAVAFQRLSAKALGFFGFLKELRIWHKICEGTSCSQLERKSYSCKAFVALSFASVLSAKLHAS